VNTDPDDPAVAVVVLADSPLNPDPPEAASALGAQHSKAISARPQATRAALGARIGVVAAPAACRRSVCVLAVTT
jgi:hypothetical protein